MGAGLCGERIIRQAQDERMCLERSDKKASNQRMPSNEKKTNGFLVMDTNCFPELYQ